MAIWTVSTMARANAFQSRKLGFMKPDRSSAMLRQSVMSEVDLLISTGPQLHARSPTMISIVIGIRQRSKKECLGTTMLARSEPEACVLAIRCVLGCKEYQFTQMEQARSHACSICIFEVAWLSPS